MKEVVVKNIISISRESILRRCEAMKIFSHLKVVVSALLLAFLPTQQAQAAFFSLDEEDRTVGEFHAVDAGGLAQVYLAPGSETRVVVKVRRIEFGDVITRNENGVLTVSTTGNHSGETVKVYVTYTKLNSVHVRGSAEVYAEGVAEADLFTVSTHGAGDIKFLQVKARRLDISINNAGNATIEVDVEVLAIEMHGVGDLEITGSAQRQNVRSFGSHGTLDNGSLQLPGL
jgi:hypothetical protein